MCEKQEWQNERNLTNLSFPASVLSRLHVVSRVYTMYMYRYVSHMEMFLKGTGNIIQNTDSTVLLAAFKQSFQSIDNV